jgi:hypothetical protein
MYITMSLCGRAWCSRIQRCVLGVWEEDVKEERGEGLQGCVSAGVCSCSRFVVISEQHRLMKLY